MDTLALVGLIAAYLCCLGRCDSCTGDQIFLLVQEIYEKIDAQSERFEELSSRLTVLEEIKNLEGIIQEYSSKQQLTDLREIMALDECRSGTHSCSPQAKCIDDVVEYHCDCPNGFSGDGFTCQDIDECIIGNHSCSVNAQCINNAGSYSCSCKAGYTGDGFFCHDVDECATGAHFCHPNSICSNTEGHHTCTCLPGYLGNGYTCETIPCYSPSKLLKDLGCVTPLTRPVTWHEAKDFCKVLGARLLEGITSKEELKELRRHFRVRFGYKDAWLGIHNGSWLESGLPIPLSSPLWGEDQPDRGDQLCGYAYIYSSYPYIADARCSSEEYAFCQTI